MTYHTVSLEERFLRASFLETRALLLILWFAQNPCSRTLMNLQNFANFYFHVSSLMKSLWFFISMKPET